MTDSVQVRASTADDWRRLRDARLAALRDSPFAYGSTFEREADFDDEIWRTRAAGEPGHRQTYLAVDGSDVLGLATVVVDGTDAEIVGVWVAPAARGRRVGTAVVSGAVDYAVESGAGRVRLLVAEDNGPAVALYESLGFADSGTTMPFERDPSKTEKGMVRDLEAGAWR